MALGKVTPLFEKIDQLEQASCLYANSFCRFRPIHSFFALISRLGDGMFWYGLMLALPLMAGTEGLALAISMAVTGLFCTFVYKLLKHKLTRERPFISFPNIFCGTAPLDRYSFPSGHTLHAVCFNLMLAYGMPALAVLILPFTILVMLSRIVLGLHYPSDVLVGALIGAGLALLGAELMPTADMLASLRELGDSFKIAASL